MNKAGKSGKWGSVVAGRFDGSGKVVQSKDLPRICLCGA
jgi:hypothetical protein